MPSLHPIPTEHSSASFAPGPDGDDSAADFFAAFGKFNDTLGDAVESLQGGFTLRCAFCTHTHEHMHIRNALGMSF